MSKKFKPEQNADQDDLSDIFSKVQIKDEKVEINGFYYSQKYLNADICIDTGPTMMAIQVTFEVTLRDIKDFIFGKKTSIEYVDDYIMCKMDATDIEITNRGTNNNCFIATNNVTIKTIARLLFDEMISFCMRSFYEDCANGFLYYDNDDELKNDLDIMITEFAKLGHKIDIEKCNEKIRSVIKLKNNKQSRKHNKYDDDDDE